MPQGWGRPPKRSRGWNRQQERYSDRFEEISSGEEEDILLFNGADPRSVPRNVQEFTDDTEDSEDQNSEGNGMQLIKQEKKMRAKEEDLVSSALARMQRAKARGKREVEMPVEERDALERKIERDQARAARMSPRETGNGRRKSNEKARSTSKSSSRSRRKSARSSMTSLEQHSSNPPGMVVAGPDGPMLVPYGAHGHHLPPGSRLGDIPRVPSGQSLVSRGGRRWVSGPEPGPSVSSPALSGGRSSSSRPLPDDPDWHPQHRPRAYSSSAHRYSRQDPYHEYALPPPIPQRFKPEYGATMGPSASDPSLNRRARQRRARAESTSPSENESGSSSSDEDGEGVEVEVAVEDGGRGHEGAKSPRRSAGHNNIASSSGAVAVRSSAGRQRKGKR